MCTYLLTSLRVQSEWTSEYAVLIGLWEIEWDLLVLSQAGRACAKVAGRARIRLVARGGDEGTAVLRSMQMGAKREKCAQNFSL